MFVTRSVENESSAIHDQMLEAREKMEELDKNEHLLRRSVNNKQEKMTKLELQHENDVASRKKEIEHMKRWDCIVLGCRSQALIIDPWEMQW